MAEQIRLPHYMAARFNLAIDHIYRGLLLGTGPQVDPGFQGVLSCPLHNISNQPILIPLGAHLATIDFIKTTRFAQESDEVLKSITSEKELYDSAHKLIGKDGHRNNLYPLNKTWVRPIIGHRSGPGDLLVSSSVNEIGRRVDSLWAWLRRLGIGSAIAVVALLFSVVSLLNQWYSDSNQDRRDIQATIRDLRVELQEREFTQRRLEAEIARLRTLLNRRP